MTSRPSMFSLSGIKSRLRKAGVTTTGSARSINGEIDLREEFDILIYGPNKDGKNRHGFPVVLRRMRRDTNGYPELCTCAEASTGSHADEDCSYCFGDGYLSDEAYIMTFSGFTGPDGGLSRKYLRMFPGNIRVDYKVFYFRYDSKIKYDDRIVEVRLDEEGQLEVPYIREAIYKPQTINNYRSDHGRIEYIAVYCREEDAVRPNYIPPGSSS